MYTGDKEGLTEVLPRVFRFAEFLKTIIDDDGLLKVVDPGVPSVWMDHVGFNKQSHKQCSFNLYTAAMFSGPLIKLLNLSGEKKASEEYKKISKSIIKSTVRKFWHEDSGMFIDNLPWCENEKEYRTHDRTHATAVLFDFCPGNNIQNSIKEMIDCPENMGFSYPANACWRLWALLKAGKAEAVVEDLRTRWFGMDSVRLNNSLQEFFVTPSDSTAQWSHCPVSPLIIFYTGIAGITPLTPGFKKTQIRPQPGIMKDFALKSYTVCGTIHMKYTKGQDSNFNRGSMEIEVPNAMEVELVLPADIKIPYKKNISTENDTLMNLRRYSISSKKKISFNI